MLMPAQYPGQDKVRAIVIAVIDILLYNITMEQREPRPSAGNFIHDSELSHEERRQVGGILDMAQELPRVIKSEHYLALINGKLEMVESEHSISDESARHQDSRSINKSIIEVERSNRDILLNATSHLTIIANQAISHSWLNSQYRNEPHHPNPRQLGNPMQYATEAWQIRTSWNDHIIDQGGITLDFGLERPVPTRYITFNMPGTYFRHITEIFKYDDYIFIQSHGKPEVGSTEPLTASIQREAGPEAAVQFQEIVRNPNLEEENKILDLIIFGWNFPSINRHIQNYVLEWKAARRADLENKYYFLDYLLKH